MTEKQTLERKKYCLGDFISILRKKSLHEPILAGSYLTDKLKMTDKQEVKILRYKNTTF